MPMTSDTPARPRNGLPAGAIPLRFQSVQEPRNGGRSFGIALTDDYDDVFIPNAKLTHLLDLGHQPGGHFYGLVELATDRNKCKFTLVKVLD